MNQALKALLDYMEQEVRQHYIHENSPLGHLFMQYKRSTLSETVVLCQACLGNGRGRE